MIRTGKLGGCGRGCQCVGKKGQRITIECHECDGDGMIGGKDCEVCGGIGEIELKRCAVVETADIVDLVTCLELFLDNGLPPVAGGVLDQAAWFVAAAKYYDIQRARLR